MKNITRLDSFFHPQQVAGDTHITNDHFACHGWVHMSENLTTSRISIAISLEETDQVIISLERVII